MMNFNDIVTNKKERTFIGKYIIENEMNDFIDMINHINDHIADLDFVMVFNLWGSQYRIYPDYNEGILTLTDKENEHVKITVTFLGGYKIRLKYEPTFNLSALAVRDFVKNTIKTLFYVTQIESDFLEYDSSGGFAWNIMTQKHCQKFFSKLKLKSIDIEKIRFFSPDVFLKFLDCIFRNNKNCTVITSKSYFDDTFDASLFHLQKFNEKYIREENKDFYYTIKKRIKLNENFNFNNIPTNSVESNFVQMMSAMEDMKKFENIYNLHNDNEDHKYFRYLMDLLYGEMINPFKMTYDETNATIHLQDNSASINQLNGSIKFLGNNEISLTTNKTFWLTSVFIQYNASPNALFKITELHCGNHILSSKHAVNMSSPVIKPSDIEKLPKLYNILVFHIKFDLSEIDNLHIINKLYDAVYKYNNDVHVYVNTKIVEKFRGTFYRKYDVFTAGGVWNEFLIKKKNDE